MQSAEGSTQPAPFVRQPFLKVAQAAVVVVVTGADVQTTLAHAEAAFYSHPVM